MAVIKLSEFYSDDEYKIPTADKVEDKFKFLLAVVVMVKIVL